MASRQEMQRRNQLVRAFETARAAYLQDKTPATECALILAHQTMMQEHYGYANIQAAYSEQVLHDIARRQALIEVIVGGSNETC